MNSILTRTMDHGSMPLGPQCMQLLVVSENGGPWRDLECGKTRLGVIAPDNVSAVGIPV